MRISTRLVLTLVAVVFVARMAEARAGTTTNLLTNPGAETGSISGWTPTGADPTVDNGTFDPGINPHSGSFDFVGGANNQVLPSGTLSQIVTLAGVQGITTTLLDTGTLSANLSFWEQGLNQGTPSDDAQVILTFLNASSSVISTVSSPFIDSHNLTWENYQNSYTIPIGTRSVDYTMVFMLNAGINIDAFVDDNSLTVTTPASVPEPGSLTLGGLCLLCCAVYGWRRQSRFSTAGPK